MHGAVHVIQGAAKVPVDEIAQFYLKHFLETKLSPILTKDFIFTVKYNETYLLEYLGLGLLSILH